jgi:hypothetical protein
VANQVVNVLSTARWRSSSTNYTRAGLAPADGRHSIATATQPFTISNTLVQSLIVSLTSLPETIGNNVAIGELVTLQARVQLLEGTHTLNVKVLLEFFNFLLS